MATSTLSDKRGAGRLAVFILIAMVLGIFFGWLVNQKIVAIDM